MTCDIPDFLSIGSDSLSTLSIGADTDGSLSIGADQFLSINLVRFSPMTADAVDDRLGTLDSWKLDEEQLNN